MSHYYLNDDKLKDQIKTINTKINDVSFTFKTNTGVFSKNNIDFGSKLLIESVEINEKIKKIADIGSGYGPIGIILSRLNPFVESHLFEINARAVELTKENIEINNVNNVFVYHNDILSGIDKQFDLIVTNPPIRAGKKTVFDIYNQAYNHLNNGGSLYVVIQKKQGAPSSFDYLSSLYEKTEIITKNKGYWIIKATKQQ